MAPYMIAQVIGGVLAALGVKYLKAGATVTPMNLATWPTLLAGFLFTFALVYVVLHVATAKGTAGNSFYGLAIGLTVMAGASAVGNISGGAFNPAVAVWISMMGLAAWSSICIYLVAEFIGGARAARVFKVVNPGDN